MDFITKLPPSEGYDTVLTITDHDCSKVAIFIPCQETIDRPGVAELYIRHVVPQYGLPKRIISDRDPRFASAFTKELCHQLGIKQNISSAYHPQTDGQSERSNQWLEQYLRFWCDARQEEWAKWLPMAEYAHNSWPHSRTKATPSELIKGYTPSVTWEGRTSNVPSVQERLQKLQELQHTAHEGPCKVQKTVTTMPKNFKPYQPGDRVWLEATNLKTTHPTAKLAPR